MLELIDRAVLPLLSLITAMRQWLTVRYRFAEPPRKRRRQREQLSFI